VHGTLDRAGADAEGTLDSLVAGTGAQEPDQPLFAGGDPAVATRTVVT
jgi:hypothetical protein